MLDTSTIMDRVREVIEHEYNFKVLDKNIAHELGISASKLSTMKSRGTMPYDELTMFCIRKKVNTNWLFFGVGSKEMDYA